MITNIILQYGAIFVPLGFVLSFFAFQFFEGWRFYVTLIMSVGLVGFGVFLLHLASKIARLEQQEENIKFYALLNEIKGFREDMRGITDGRINKTRSK